MNRFTRSQLPPDGASLIDSATHGTFSSDDLDFGPSRELEVMLSELALKAPSEQLDQRVASLIHQATKPELHHSEHSATVSRTPAARATPRSFMALACCSILCLMAGYWLGQLTSYRSTIGQLHADSMQANLPPSPVRRSMTHSATDPISQNSHHKELMAKLPLVFMNWNPALNGQTPRERARQWSEATGLEFSVETHVSESQFSYCRSCHVVGG